LITSRSFKPSKMSLQARMRDSQSKKEGKTSLDTNPLNTPLVNQWV
jgi:hypothetical protein